MFHDRFGSFSGPEGAALLEAILWRREIAQGQAELLRRRAQTQEVGMLRPSTAELLLAVSRARRQKSPESSPAQSQQRKLTSHDCK